MRFSSTRAAKAHSVSFGSIELPLSRGRRPRQDGAVILGIRPADFHDPELAPVELPRLEVEVAVVEELGSETNVIFWVDARRVVPEGAASAAGTEDAQLLASELIPNSVCHSGLGPGAWFT